MRSAPGFEKHPDHQIKIERADGTWCLTLAGEELAKSSNILILQESNYPDRFYFPMQDVKSDLLKPIDHHSYCPFKGTARYWDVAINGNPLPQAAWGYDDPYFECSDLTGYVCFYMEKANFELQKQ